MSSERPIPLTIVASRNELAPEARVWGTGGWLAPEEREALDWLTLALLFGWSPVLVYRDGARLLEAFAASRAIVVAADPNELPEPARSALRTAVEEYGAVVFARAGRLEGAWANWVGTGFSNDGQDLLQERIAFAAGCPDAWSLRKPIAVQRMEIITGVETIVACGDRPLVLRRRKGAGQIFTLACHPSALRDVQGEGTALLRRLLVTGPASPIESLDLAGTMVLRMDDPGCCANVYLESWCYPKLTSAQWSEVGSELKQRKARLSVGYVSGWVDDGDAERGALWVDGREVIRKPGAIYPSWSVRYCDHKGHAPGRVIDYSDEYRGLRALMEAGLASMEAHGHTHLTPDLAAWLAAPDQYHGICWFREFGPAATRYCGRMATDPHPLALSLREIERAFLRRPTTVIFPGEEFTRQAMEVALDLRFELIGSYYLAIRWKDRWCWTTHVCSPYLDDPSADWFSSGLPVVGYFHDKEIADYGIEWLQRHLDAWQGCGARRWIDYASLANLLKPALSGHGSSPDSYFLGSANTM